MLSTIIIDISVSSILNKQNRIPVDDFEEGFLESRFNKDMN
jgi:hypothetical protein